MDLEGIRSNRVKAILRFSIPSIIAMVLTSLITVVDGLFIGNYVGKEGVAAVNLGLPIVYLFLAVGLVASVGGAAIAGIAFGAGDVSKCRGVFNQTMATVMVASLLLGVVVWFCLNPMLGFLRADARVSGHFKDYYGVMLTCLPFTVVNASFGMFIRGEGKPQYFMQVNVLNVLLNILLDYVFVRWVGWGIKGVAIASLLSAVVTFACILDFFIRRAKVYRFGAFAFSADVMRQSLLNGGSEFVGEMSLCISMFAYNFVILRHIGVDGVTAFTIVGYISYIFSMVLIGFGQGVFPLVSFAYGAGERPLAMGLRRITNGMVVAAGVAVFLLVLVGSGWYGGLFVKSEAVEGLVRSGVVIFSFSFLFSGMNVISSFYFTSIGKAMESAAISLARGLVVLLTCIFTFPPLLGMTGVWLVAPVTEGITLLLSLALLYRDKAILTALR